MPLWLSIVYGHCGLTVPTFKIIKFSPIHFLVNQKFNKDPVSFVFDIKSKKQSIHSWFDFKGAAKMNGHKVGWIQY